MKSEFIAPFLPEGILNHFGIESIYELCELRTKLPFYMIELVEKNHLFGDFNQADYESKGFYETKIVQDFPIRGKAVYLEIKRRRWRHKVRKEEIISNDYSYIAEGSKITKELSDFLKDTGRDPRRHHW
ncbi:MAG: transposase [Cytophagaceae bacterium]